MTDYDYGYWIMWQPGAPVAAIRGAVLREARCGYFTDFGHGVYDAVKCMDTAVSKVFTQAYRYEERQHMIGGAV